MTEDIAREIICEYDLDNDGKLCFEEFAKLLMDDKGDDMINENLQQWGSCAFSSGMFVKFFQ